MNLQLTKYFTLPIFYVIGGLLCFYPYVFNQFLQLGGETTLLLVFLFFTIVLLRKGTGGLPPILIKCIWIQVLMWIVYMVIHNDTSYISRVFFIVMSSALLIFLIRQASLFRFVDTYNHFIALQAVLGVPVFFLFALGIITPFSSFHNIDGREAYFFGVTFSNAITGGICRIAGFFDEPGALAFWGLFALVFNKITVDNHKLEIVLIFSLLFTLSAAYFILLIVYVTFYYGSRIRIILPVILLLCIIGYGTFKYIGNNEQLMYMTVERFQGGSIRSDRALLTDDAKKIFKECPIIGIGAKNLQEKGYFDDNPYEIPAKDGVVGFVVTYLPLFVLLFKYGRKNRKILFAIILLMAEYMQRPFHVNLLHFFIMYLFVLLVYYKIKGYEI